MSKQISSEAHTCVYRYSQISGRRVLEALIVDERRRLLAKIQGLEGESALRRRIEIDYPGIEYAGAIGQ